MLPNFFMITIPMAVLVGVLLGLSRLAADNEIIAMRASGMGIGYFVRVSSIVAIFGTLLGLFNSMYVAPRANQAILAMDKALAVQASYEIEPRVFDEDFHNYVLYVQDVRSGTGAANWRQVFMADTTDPTTPLITTAASATVANDAGQELLMRLRDGARHETVAGQPQQYNISTFDITDMPLAPSQQSEGHLGRMDTAIYALHMNDLRARIHGPDGKRYLIELHKRFAYPAACLVLMLVAVPLGFTSRRGGKSSAWVATLALVIIYYSLSLIGIALGKQNWISAFLAVWMANLLFAAGGIFLVWQMAFGGRFLNSIVSWISNLQDTLSAVPEKSFYAPLGGLINKFQSRPRRVKARNILPRILDKYVVREFLGIFLLVLAGFVSLILVFTVFDLLKDILSHDIGWLIVGQYLINLAPSILYQTTPPGRADCRAGHLRRAESQLGNHRHEGLRHQPIPAGSSHRFDRRHPVAQPISLRPVLSAPGQPQARGSAQHHQGQTAANRSASRAELDLRPAESRRARSHLLLPILRRGTQRVRQSLHLRVRPCHLCSLAAHLCRSRHVGSRIRFLDFPERLAARH
jgi:LPS export ABC transporter permease LptF